MKEDKLSVNTWKDAGSYQVYKAVESKTTKDNFNEPTMTHHYYPNSIVCTTVHSCYCTVYGFGQIYNDMYP